MKHMQLNNVDKLQTNKVSAESETKEETQVEEKKVCHNKSLNKKFTYGVQALDPFPLGYQKSWYDVDPANYYKKYKPIPIPIEDKLIRGYNETSYITSGGLYDVGRINLNDKKQRYAQPNNYILSK